VHKVVTDTKRYRAECKANGCPWRIVANRLVGQPTVEVCFFSNFQLSLSSYYVTLSLM
jgi:hypothetical protein